MKFQPITIEMPDGVMTGWHFPCARAQNTAPLRLFFIHATGFCAFVYRLMLENLKIGGYEGDQFSPLIHKACDRQNIEIFAMDMRGHGQTRLTARAETLKSWEIYVEDVHHCLDHLNHCSGGDQTPWVLGGHSMGAVTALMAGARRDDVRAIAMIEPVAVPEILSIIAATPFWPILAKGFPMAVNAARRRNHWQDRQAVTASYERKTLFKSWHEGVLEDYLKDGLIDKQGGVSLACHPEWEAATFRAQANPFWRNARVLSAKRHSVSGDCEARDPKVSVMASRLEGSTVSARAQARFEKMGFKVERDAAFTHLLPMESPVRAAAFLSGAMV